MVWCGWSIQFGPALAKPAFNSILTPSPQPDFRRFHVCFGTNNSNFWPLKAIYWAMGQNNQMCSSLIFFITVKAFCYKWRLGCNSSYFLIIFLWKLIKNGCSANTNLKKLLLQSKFSNFWMLLVPIKNLCPFSHNKCDKHCILSKKDLTEPNWTTDKSFGEIFFYLQRNSPWQPL